MGCLPSKSFKGEGHRLGSAPSSTSSEPVARRTVQPLAKQMPSVAVPAASAAPAGRVQDARSKAAEAAQKRAESSVARGTSSSNPNKGKLSEQLSNQKKGSMPVEDQMPERIVYD